jgi:hypothetical protein
VQGSDTIKHNSTVIQSPDIASGDFFIITTGDQRSEAGKKTGIFYRRNNGPIVMLS